VVYKKKTIPVAVYKQLEICHQTQFKLVFVKMSEKVIY
jgi:hypothetical protein